MQAVILAGGLGTRLRPITKTVPKVMVPVNGQPFIAHLLELLSSNGINEVLMCTGYLRGQIKEYLGDGSRFGVKIAYSEESGELLGTAGAIKLAQALLDERFFIINGDTYLPIDYGKVEASFVEAGKKALMVVCDNGSGRGVKGNVELGADSMVVRYDKRSSDPGLKYVDAGVLALRREELDRIEGGQPISLEAGLYPKLIREMELVSYVTAVRFYDIGAPEQLEMFGKYLRGLPR
jgi:mannose-1-phosphate guanylyltransferase